MDSPVCRWQFAPLTGLEVLGTRVEGAVMVVSVKLSINLTSATMEQVVGKRKKMLQDMLPARVRQLKSALEQEAWMSPQGINFLVGRLPERCARGSLAHDTEWYNEDVNLSSAIIAMGQECRSLGPPFGAARVEELAAVTVAERAECGVEGPPEAFTPVVRRILERCEQPEPAERAAAVAALGTDLPPTAVAQHASALVAALRDSNEQVRSQAASLLDTAGHRMLLRKPSGPNGSNASAPADVGVLSFPSSGREAKFITVSTSSCADVLDRGPRELGTSPQPVAPLTCSEAPPTLLRSCAHQVLAHFVEKHFYREPPELHLTVTGGAVSLDLEQPLIDAFDRGLAKLLVARRVLMLSGGSHSGVMKLMGDSLVRSGCDDPLIGVIPLGVVKGRQVFDGCQDAEKRFTYQPELLPTPSEPHTTLDPGHTHFIFTDDGATGKFGGEDALRARLEDHLVMDMSATPKRRRLPAVLLIVGGGPGTLQATLLIMQKQVPSVVVSGSGGVTDLLMEIIKGSDLTDEVVASWQERFKFLQKKGDWLDVVDEIKRLQDASGGRLLTSFGLTADALHDDLCTALTTQAGHVDAAQSGLRRVDGAEM